MRRHPSGTGGLDFRALRALAAERPAYRKFDVVECAGCGDRFLNTAHDGVFASCRSCAGRELAVWRRSGGPLGPAAAAHGRIDAMPVSVGRS